MRISQLVFVIVTFTIFITCTQGIAKNIDDLISETKKNPSSAVAHNKLGLAYSNTGKYHKAIAEYRKALKINPTFALVYNNLGSAYHEIGLVNQAISEYKKCLELMPNSYKTLANNWIEV